MHEKKASRESDVSRQSNRSLDCSRGGLQGGAPPSLAARHTAPLARAGPTAPLARTGLTTPLLVLGRPHRYSCWTHSNTGSRGSSRKGEFATVSKRAGNASVPRNRDDSNARNVGVSGRPTHPGVHSAIPAAQPPHWRGCQPLAGTFSNPMAPRYRVVTDPSVTRNAASTPGRRGNAGGRRPRSVLRTLACHGSGSQSSRTLRSQDFSRSRFSG